MCGIVGILGSHNPTLIRQMASIIEHRGPDSCGFLDSKRNKFSIGMQRLSILDIANGDQPIKSRDGSVSIVFNGEIYNYKYIRKKLAALGGNFSTNSDTEVVLQAYLQWGRKAWEKLAGMFSICIVDERGPSPIFLLVRDHVGMKPLYYLKHNGELRFASELKSLLIALPFERKLNNSALFSYLSLRFVSGGDTMMQGIEKLSPGHELIWNNNTVETHQWWNVGSLNNVNDRYSLNDSINLIGDSLKTSVERHMIADVPIGSYLSGGIDSNVITALMANASNKKINTFTMGFEGYSNDDTRLARLSSLALNTEHHEIFCTNEDMRLLPDIAYSLDEPIGDPIVVPLTMLSAEASKYVKVVLSGEGADEILGGYMFYKKINLIQNLKRIFPSFCFMTLAKLIDYFPPMLLDRFFDYPGMLGQEGRKKLSALVMSIPNSTIQELFLRSIALNDKEEFDKMMSSKSIFKNITLDQIENSNLEGLSPIRALTKIQMHSWLPDDILLMADKLSMKNSLELRSPYLDIDVLNACSAIPDKHKIQKGINKYVLREFGKTLLPAEIINAPKRPFYLPLESYYKQKELNELFKWALDEERIKKRGLFSNEWVKDQKNKTDQGGFLPLKKLFSIVMLEVWMEKFSCDV